MCTTIDIFYFNLYEFVYWSVVLCIYCGTLNNSYCIGELHLAEMPWSFILVLKKLWRNSVTKSNCNGNPSQLSVTIDNSDGKLWRNRHNFRHNLWWIPSQSSKKSSSSIICLKLWRKFPPQNICDAKNSVTNVGHNKLWRKPVRHNLNCDQWNCDGQISVTVCTFPSQFLDFSATIYPFSHSGPQSI